MFRVNPTESRRETKMVIISIIIYNGFEKAIRNLRIKNKVLPDKIKI